MNVLAVNLVNVNSLMCCDPRCFKFFFCNVLIIAICMYIGDMQLINPFCIFDPMDSHCQTVFLSDIICDIVYVYTCTCICSTHILVVYLYVCNIVM